MNLLELVKEFHVKYELPVSEKPSLLEPELSDFRIEFMYEELNEYDDAMVLEDKEMMLDALVDLVYVAIGTAVMHGFDFNEAFRRVHEANMKKVRALSADQSRRGTTYDVVKPEGWTPPCLKDLVE